MTGACLRCIQTSVHKKCGSPQRSGYFERQFGRSSRKSIGGRGMEPELPSVSGKRATLPSVTTAFTRQESSPISDGQILSLLDIKLSLIEENYR